MDRIECVTALKAHAEFLKKDCQYSSNEKIMQAIRLAVEILKNGKSEYEYATFLWSKSHGRYVQVCAAVTTELLCRNRIQEYIDNGWLSDDYDTSKVVIKRRETARYVGEWEEVI